MNFRKIFLRSRLLIILCLAIILLGITQLNTLAQTPVVRAIFFYSPTCGHCYKVITEDLSPLLEKYRDQLIILGVDITNEEGQALYLSAVQALKIPTEQIVTPLLVVGDNALVGSVDIPNYFPGIIEDGLSQGGIDWPEIPGLAEILVAVEQSQTNTNVPNQEAPTQEISTPTVNSTIDQTNTNVTSDETPQNVIVESISDTPAIVQPGIAEKFKRDIVGNTISVIVLVGMIGCVVWAFAVFLSNSPAQRDLIPYWMIPILSIIGLAIASYLFFVEFTQAQAVCGPVGDCNTVQQSPYAYLFGIVPVGAFGMLGYIVIIIAWIVQYLTSNPEKKFVILAIWALAWFGTLFSIYLTFLEPFVIGATCMWCISSALIMALLLITSTPKAVREISEKDELEDIELELIEVDPADKMTH